MPKTPYASPKAGRKLNKNRILRIIADGGKISNQDLANKLGISVPTVLQNVRELIEAGVVKEEGVFQSTGGRKAKAIVLAPESRCSLGVDVTEYHVEAVMVNLAGRVVTHRRFPLPFSTSAGYFRKVGKCVESLIRESRLGDDAVLGVGFSIPGIVDASGMKVEYSHILGVSDLPTASFSSQTPYPCVFVNDANAAGFAEFYRRGDLRNAAYLSLSGSVGGAIFFGGELYFGNNQRSGEFGHATLVPGGKPCYCGKTGCLDAYCSSKVLAGKTGGSLSLFFDKLKAGDAGCGRAWETYLNHLAAAINSIRMSFDCDVVVGGYVGGYLDGHIDNLREKLAKLNTFERDGAYARSCNYKHEASAAGAALQHIFSFINGV